MTYKIKQEVIALYNEVKKNNMQLDHDVMMYFLSNMPEQAIEVLNEIQYGRHIVSKEFYEEAIKLIKNKDDKPITHWSVSDVSKIASNYINIDNEDYFIMDLAFQANARKGDYEHIIPEPSTIVRIAIADLSDCDYVYGASDERAYCMAKKLIENEKKSKL